MCGLDVRKQAFERVANACRITNLSEGLHEPGMNLNAARAFMQKFKVQLTPHSRDGAARIAQNLSLIRS